MHGRRAFGFHRLGDERHACLSWRAAAFFDVALEAAADDVVPRGFAALRAGNHVVEA